MSIVYVFEASIVKYTKNRVAIYPPSEYQEKLKRFYGRRVKVQIVIDRARVTTYSHSD